MNKKTKVKLELEDTIKAYVPSIDSCGVCHSHFSCALSRESHFKLYPLHVLPASIGMPDDQKEVILTEDLNGKRYNKRV